MKSLFVVVSVVAALMLPAVGAQGQTRRKRAPVRRATGASGARQATPASPATPAAAAAKDAVTTASGLTCLITHHGSGRQPVAGETVLVHYTGVLTGGVKFDSSRDRGEPIAFKLGAGRVIKGWDEGIARLHVGDQAVLVIPPQLGYGERGAGDVIPPGATLVFIVELMDVKATSLSESLSKVLAERGIEAVVARYRELKSGGLGDVYASESDMNGWGYRLLREKRVKEAIEIFKLNVEAYPTSANVYDSLAEAYLADGDRQAAIESYRKALEIDPQMESARKALKTLTGS